MTLTKRFVTIRCAWLVVCAASLLVAALAQASGAAEPAPPTRSQGKASRCTLQDRSGCRINFVVHPEKIVVRTGSVVLDGAQLPRSASAYLLKNALHRPWSYARDNRNLMV